MPFAATVNSTPAGLSQFVTTALADDPTLARARALTLQAAEEARQARAPLLPEVSLRSERARQRNGLWVTSSELRMTQPLINRNATSTLAAVRAQARAVAADGEAARQDLLLRAALAWMFVDLRRQERQFAIADRDALAFQAKRSQARYDVGLAPRIDAIEAEAQRASAVARVHASEIALDDAREALAQIAAQWRKRPSHRRVPWRPSYPVAGESHEALAVTSARHRLEAADHRRRAARVSRWPVVDLQLRYGRSNGRTDAPSPFGRRPGWVFGLRLTVPLMSSVTTSANVRRANADWDAARAELDLALRDATRATRRLEAATIANESIRRARESAEIAAHAAVMATHAALEMGTRTTVDALLAQRRLFDTRRAAAQARANQFLDRLRLAAARGVLGESTLEMPR
ncbi:TolC family protein [Pinirhizobacter sp.]|uniref:TolC family protein n=1 Tax=Pinirhizobacter sp. TaxID=2950432 RepID=UPI0039C8C09B